MITLTHAGGQRVIPLCQGIGDCFTAYSRGPLQSVAWVALEHNSRAHRKVIANAFAKARLGN